jgi:hypothetical protein
VRRKVAELRRLRLPSPDPETSMMKLRAIAAVSAALLLAACSEGQQIGQATTYKQGKYQGKPDAKPYESAPGVYSQGVSWNAGDKTSWEAAVRNRQQNQNEYTRAP